MADRYQQFTTSALGAKLADLVGLPAPTRLRRHEPGQPVVTGPVLLHAAPGGRLVDEAAKALVGLGADVVEASGSGAETAVPEGPRLAALVVDASGLTGSEQYAELWPVLRAGIRRLGECGRVVLLGTPPALCEDVREQTAQRALEGLVHSIGKELRDGATAQLIEVAPGAEAGLDAPLRFVLSARSAFVSGQRITVGPATGKLPAAPTDLDQPLAGKVALVTGAARGIGAAFARTLSRDGATVVCLDIPAAGDHLAKVANQVGGTALQVDITADDAPARIAQHLSERHGGVDLVIHNAGVTRDKLLAGMDDKRWDLVLDVNLLAQERIDEALLGSGKKAVLRPGGRIVSVSSMSGIAGNRGQTNYATSKAGVIGRVTAMAPVLAEHGGTINAVAPGFIETDMTDAMPLGPREVGRRISSLGQGGQPVDVAEAIGFFCWPDSAWVNGVTLRVCGQNLLGA